MLRQVSQNTLVLPKAMAFVVRETKETYMLPQWRILTAADTRRLTAWLGHRRLPPAFIGQSPMSEVVIGYSESMGQWLPKKTFNTNPWDLLMPLYSEKAICRRNYVRVPVPNSNDKHLYEGHERRLRNRQGSVWGWM